MEHLQPYCYWPCPNCGATEGMGLSGIPDHPGRTAVWCCYCKYFGPEIVKPTSRETDMAAIKAWNEESEQAHLQLLKQVNGVVSSTYGDLVKACYWVAKFIEPHEWDNKTISEQRDWALQQLDASLERLFGHLHPYFLALEYCVDKGWACGPDPRRGRAGKFVCGNTIEHWPHNIRGEGDTWKDAVIAAYNARAQYTK